MSNWSHFQTRENLKQSTKNICFPYSVSTCVLFEEQILVQVVCEKKIEMVESLYYGLKHESRQCFSTVVVSFVYCESLS